ncbi:MULTISPECIES: HAD family hydrolase [unclassified Pseudomonas]|uniref:HAD family hydrolase n=1 Tax=unclassified Pseudomonas TaxID=196821 RepID=UPI001F471BB9|nr:MULTISPECIES: HAD family hydrolase [unclassified Pseudomonas]MCF5231790.1 HAD-IA family hydrolase [Pseudomonas sp. PA-5-4H]MCF5235190.1 HAD-IA family hydrolase [Pseudomonas sp. PA-5-4G]MCF5247544.1 HAD-IA family hydrolase [Pseudomonas sp. PA-5-4B]MCF5254221.1 HAD-IA family hydrolase [Pseudomonas sp. PA-5-4B]MCF5258823.1 HAD-IA family hydrolase [Pseudomonas sp. PA-5-4A]
MSLSDVKYWVFDMDGTLTVAVHDFVAIRVALDIPPEDDILTHLAALPADVAAAKHAWLLEHERELAVGSVAAVGAVQLVRELAGRGYRLGILTRNARELAHITLEAIGLADCFAVEDVLGRDDAPPKPDPGGLLKLATAWKVAPSAMVMVGDYRFDLVCGRAAGTRTVLVNLPENPWPELADWHAEDCAALRRML